MSLSVQINGLPKDILLQIATLEVSVYKSMLTFRSFVNALTENIKMLIMMGFGISKKIPKMRSNHFYYRDYHSVVIYGGSGDENSLHDRRSMMSYTGMSAVISRLHPATISNNGDRFIGKIHLLNTGKLL